MAWSGRAARHLRHDGRPALPDALVAREGFLAAAPDLFHRGKIRRLFAICARLEGPARPNLRRCGGRSLLVVQQEGCTGRIGVVGFCLTGGFALLLGPDHGFGAASVNYGGPLPKGAEALLTRACPIVASYGAKDHWGKGAAQKLERVLTAADARGRIVRFFREHLGG